MLRNAIVTLMLAGLATVAAAETVYKWVDAGGQVHYTDLPPDQPGAKLLGTFQREQVLLGTDEEAAGEDEPAPTYETGAEPGDDGDAAAAMQRDLDAVRSEQCKQAQARYKNYIESRRLYRETADGKREYLTDAELDAARVQARKDVDELCK